MSLADSSLLDLIGDQTTVDVNFTAGELSALMTAVNFAINGGFISELARVVAAKGGDDRRYLLDTFQGWQKIVAKLLRAKRKPGASDDTELSLVLGQFQALIDQWMAEAA